MSDCVNEYTSKQMPEHHRIFKLYKAGFYNKVTMTDEERTLLGSTRHYECLSLGSTPNI